ncbi:MAG: tRNA lysidine(34) synthetase TilS [Elusimicrobiota bacterium]
MLQKIKRFIDKYKMLKKNDKVLIGLSGGPDSVFLSVILLNEVKNLFKLKVFACHVDHQYRKDSCKDAQFVKRFCEKLNIPVVIKKIKGHLSGKKFSEEKARILRYQIFYKVAKKFGCTKIATAHTLDDNAETVLMWLARGCGLNGITGIPPKRKNIIRPILCVAKQEIINYLKKNKIKYCVDRTNLSAKFTRNKIRLKIIPELEKINPKVKKHIFQFCEILRGVAFKKSIDKIDKKVYNYKIRKFIPKETQSFFDADKIDIKKLKIRKWKPGDRMIPFGMANSKKLQDIFTDEKVPKILRKKIPIVCENKKILWVAGVKRSNDAPITEDTEMALKVEFKKNA